MTDYAEYANERKAYISHIRNSFEQGEAFTEDTLENTGIAGWGIRLRLAVSAIFFLLFLYWYDSGLPVGNMAPEQVMDLIEDNRYDTILQEVLAAGETAVSRQR